MPRLNIVHAIRYTSWRQSVLCLLTLLILNAPLAQAQSFTSGSSCDPTRASCIPSGSDGGVCSLFPDKPECKPSGGGGGGGSCTAPPGGSPSCGGSGPASTGGGGSGGVMVGGGNPINLISGNKYQEETDLAPLPGVLGLELKRYYNSLSSHAGIAGPQWRLSYETVLYDLGSQIQVLQADGRRLTLAKGPGGTLCTSPQLADGQVRIERLPNGQPAYHWRWADGRTLTFMGGSGGGFPLHRITAPTGDQLHLRYNPLGDLIGVTDPQGRSLSLHYGRASPGQRPPLEAVETPLGRLRHSQDSRGRLTEVAFQPKNGEASTTRLYHYEEANQAGNTFALTGISLRTPGAKDQRLSTYAYDATGAAILTTRGQPQARDAKGQILPDTGLEQLQVRYETLPLPHEGTPDRNGEIQPKSFGRIVLTNALSQTTVLRSAIIGGQLRLIDSRGAGCATCGPANVSYGYDREGRLIRTTQLTPEGAPIRAELRRYDTWGRLKETARQTFQNAKPQAAQWTQRVTYADQRFADGSLALGQQPVKIEHPSVIPGKTRSIELEYNNKGQLLRITERGWSPIDAQGKENPTPLDRTTRYRYETRNGRSLLTEIDGPLPNGPKGSPEDSDVARLEWDAKGRHLIKADYPGMLVTQWEYDTLGRISRVTPFDKIPVHFSYDADGKLTERQRAGTVEHLSKAPGQQTLTVNGERWFTLHTTRTGLVTHRVDAHGGQVVQGFDSDSHLAALARFNAEEARSGTALTTPVQPLKPADLATVTASGSDDAQVGRQGKHSRRRDDFDRVVQISNPVTGISWAQYDNADRLKVSAAQDGRRVRYEHDLAGHLRRQWQSQNGQEALVRSFEYRGPYLTRASSPDAEEISIRDAQGRITERQRKVGSYTYVERYEYDPQGRPVRQQLPDGRQVAYTWTGPHITRVSVDGDPLVTDIQYLPGSDAPIAYRLAGQQVVWQPSGEGYQVSWNKRTWMPGRLESVPQQAGPKPAPTVERPLFSATPTAATLDEDISADPAPEGNETRILGNPSRWADWQLRYDALNRLVAASRGDKALTYGYDAWGAQTLVRAGPAGQIQRIALYEDYRRLLEADGEGRITTQYLYLPAPGAWRLIGRITRDGVQALFTDTRGAVVEARAPRGDLLWHARYDERGQLVHLTREAAVSTATRWIGELKRQFSAKWLNGKGIVGYAKGGAPFSPRLPGQYADPDTSLHQNWHRNYDPVSGRYLEPDPLGIAGGPDLYAYAEGQPLLYIDPRGLAKLRYFAIDDGKRADPDLMPNQSHWAFAIYEIADHPDKVLIYDKGGSYFTGKSFELYKGTVPATQIDSLARHYDARAGYFSPAAFEVTLSDHAAKGIIQNLSGEDLGLTACPASTAILLPTIDMGLQGTLDPQASGEPNRIVPCKSGATDEEVRFERIKKAIEVHESADNDCSRATSYFNTKAGCPALTWNPSQTPGTTVYAPASSGWVQFIFRTLAGELRVNFAYYKGAMDSLGITQDQLNAAEKRMASVKVWYDKIDSTTWTADGTSFTSQTGLDKANFDRMQWFRKFKSLVEGAIGGGADKSVPLFKESLKGKKAAHRVNAALWRSNLLKATKLTWTERVADGKTVTRTESDTEFENRRKLRDDLTALSANLGVSMSDDKSFDPYIRDGKNWGEALAGFQVAALLAGDKPLANAFQRIFTDKSTHDLIADSWLKKLIKRVGKDGLTSVTPTTAAGEKGLAEYVFSKHNGGEGVKTKIADYIAKTIPHWERTYCVQSNKSDAVYIKLAPLAPLPAGSQKKS